MILISEILSWEYFHKRKEQLRLIEKTLVQHNFDKYTIHRCLQTFDDTKRKFFRSPAFGYPNSNIYSPLLIHKIEIEEDEVIFKILNIPFTTDYLVGLLKQIIILTNGDYKIQINDIGFTFEPSTKKMNKKLWNIKEIRKQKFHYAQIYSNVLCPEAATDYYNRYVLLKTISNTNTRLSFKSSIKNIIDLTIEVS